MSFATPPPNMTILVAAAIIAKPDGTILITQRPEDSKLRGMWEFPGGKVEPGEDPRRAVERECKEELDIEVEAGAIYETIFHTTGNQPILLLFYLVRIISGTPRSMEKNNLKWVTPTEMQQYPLLEPDIPLVKMFLQDFPHFR